MSQPPLPPFNPGAVHVTPSDEETEFENGPDADLAQQGDPNWDVPQYNPDGTPYHNPGPSGTVSNETNVPTSPLATAEEASRIAGAALHDCDANHISINDDKGRARLYLKLEAWQAIAAYAGTKPSLIIVKDNVLGGVAGITARVGLKNASGKLLSEAEGFVGNDEPFWASKPMSDRQNMAQTRAAGRVFRLCYSYIVQLMNKEYGRQYEVTPAEEMLASQQAAPVAQYGGTMRVDQVPQPGVRHVMPMQPVNPYVGGQPYQPQPPNVVPYQQPIPAPQPYAPPNQAPNVGQGETWRGMLANIEIKQVQGKRGISQLFIIYLSDGKNASTFDKTIAGNAGQLIGQSVEMMVIPRGQGRYNVGQLRPL